MELYSESLFKLLFISVISASFGIYSSFYLMKRFKFKREYNKLKCLREARILEKKANLKNFQKYLNESKIKDGDDEIINKSFSELIKVLQKDQLSRDNVLYAYQKKAFDVDSKLNCVVDFIDIDKSRINFNGPLAGLPISIKDNFLIKDYYSAVGCSYFLDNVARKNSVLVDVIRALGGVPFVKTTVPQSMMSFLSSNPIDGMTLNPLDPSKTSGGSSSGEGALIGGHGSIVGIGTDIGGSVRLPAAFCGVVGFKPTYGRLSKKGLVSLSANTIVHGVCGLLGRDVDAIAYLFKHIVNSSLHRRLDPTVVPLDFNSDLYQSKDKMRIGYFAYDRSYLCVPAMTRSVLETVKSLERNGHKVVRWNPPIAGEQWLEMFLGAIAADRVKDIRDICQYDAKDFTIRNLLALCDMNYFQYLYKMFEAHLKGNKEMLIWLRASRGISSSAKVMELLSNISKLRNRIIDDWNKLDLDVVICPSAGFTTLPLKPGSLTGMMSYQNLWNLVDFPAGTVPVSKVTQSDIEKMVQDYPKDLSNWHTNTFKAQIDSLNMPISVQCVSRPWKEETLLRIMKEIHE